MVSNEEVVPFTNEDFNRKSDRRSYILSLLFWIALGLTPWPKSLRKNSYINATRRIYLFLLSLVVCSSGAFIISQRIFIHRGGHIRYMVLMYISISLLAVMNVFILLNNIILKCHDYDEFLEKLSFVDELIWKYIRKISKQDFKYAAKVTFFNIVVHLTLLMFMCIYRGDLGLAIEFIVRYRIIFKLLVIKHYIEQIGLRYEAIDTILKELFQNQIDTRIDTKYCLLDMLHCLQLMNTLIRLFNNVIGWFLTIFTFTIIIRLIVYIETSLLRRGFTATTMVLVSYTLMELVSYKI